MSENKKSNTYKIVVWLKKDYSESDDFECPNTWTEEEIYNEVDNKYEIWYFFDIW